MKKVLVLLPAMCVCAFLWAQEVNVTWGRTNPIPKKSYIKKIISVDEDGFYVLRYRSTGFLTPYVPFMERYSRKDFRMESAKPLIIPRIKGQETEYENLIHFGGKLLLFNSFYDKATKKNTAYVQEIGKNTRMGNPVKLDEIDAVSSKKAGIFDFVLSEDSAMLLVYHNEPFNKGKNEKFSYKVFDVGMNKIWNKDIELPYKDEDVTIADYILDKHGNVHLLAKITNEGTRWTKGHPNFKYLILSYFQEANELKEFEVDLKERSVSDITLRTDAEGNLIAAGFYSNIARSIDEIGGIFFLRIDTRNMTVVSKNVQDFDKSLLADFLAEKQAEKGKELEYFDLDYLEPTADGGVLLVAEQYHYKQTCYTDPRTGIMECTDNYYYNDIMVIKLDTEGMLRWSKRIPKNQFSTNDGAPYASCLVGFTDEKVFLIFNDNPKNLTAAESSSVKYMNNPARSVVVKVVLDMEGNIVKSILFSAKDTQTVIQPKITLPITRYSSIIYGAGRRICKFGEISYY